jgi:hypothetical protein
LAWSIDGGTHGSSETPPSLGERRGRARIALVVDAPAATITASQIVTRHEPLAATSKLASSAKRQAILVLGMHRSGTSAVTGAISTLGVSLPKKTLMGEHECNLRGLFEAFSVAVAHDELLASAGSHWHDWRQLDEQWFHSPKAEPHRRDIREVLVNEFDDDPFVVIKDPRICRFVPFFASILAELNVDAVAVLPIRNPLEVAYSLRRRNGFTLSKSTLLWLRHVLDAEFHSRHMPRCFLSYEDFLLDWRAGMSRIVDQTRVIWPDWSERSNAKVDEFLTEELRHERVPFDETEGRSDISPWVLETYKIFMNIATNGESKQLLDRLDCLRSKFDEGCQVFGALVAAEELAAANSSVVAERNSLAAAHDSLVAKHDALILAYNRLIGEHDVLV